MSWIRLSDDFADHPKVRKLSKTAGMVHVWTLCHCARHLTDGFVDLGDLAGCPWVSKRSALVRAIGNLEVAGLWEREDGGWRIHDYLEYNPDRASVLESRRLAAERQARWREGKQRPRNGVSNASTDERVTHTPTPAPKGAGVEEDAAPLGGASSSPEHLEHCLGCDRLLPASDLDNGFCDDCPPVSFGGEL